MGFIVIVQIITLKMYSAAGMVCMVCLQCALDCPIITVNTSFVMSGRMMKCAPIDHTSVGSASVLTFIAL